MEAEVVAMGQAGVSVLKVAVLVMASPGDSAELSSSSSAMGLPQAPGHNNSAVHQGVFVPRMLKGSAVHLLATGSVT